MTDDQIFRNLPTIETARLVLRPFTPDDLQDVFDYASHPEVPRFLPWKAHETLDDSRAFLDMVLKAYQEATPASFAIVLKESGKVIGSGGFNRWEVANRAGEIGYALGFDHWGKGLMTEALRALVAFGFEQMDLNRVAAIAEVENIGSWRVMEKAGMAYEGTLREVRMLDGRPQSFKVYSILRREWAP